MPTTTTAVKPRTLEEKASVWAQSLTPEDFNNANKCAIFALGLSQRSTSLAGAAARRAVLAVEHAYDIKVQTEGGDLILVATTKEKSDD